MAFVKFGPLVLAASLAAGCHDTSDDLIRNRDASVAVIDADTRGGSSDGGSSDGSLDMGEAALPTYPGCEAPSTTFLRTVYIDPATGDDAADGTQAHPWKTLASALSAQKVIAGDHVIVLRGERGRVSANKSSNPALVGASAWTWIDVQDGAVFSGLALSDMSRWLVTKAEVTGTSGTLVTLSGGSSVVVSDASVYTAKDSTGWTADRWIHQTASAISTRNTTCVALLRNHVTNVRFGITVASDGLTVADSRLDTLVRDNVIRNFSGDGMRPLGSNVTFTNNSIFDVYVSPADGDPNHDDAIQGFAAAGADFDNVTIEGTWIQETTDPTRPLQSDLQGISIFDGLYSNVTVRRNVVLVGAYDGISVFGPNGAVIEHNTVIGINPAHRLRIWVPSSKMGVAPVRAVVRDNLANIYLLDAAVTSTNDPIVNTSDAALDFVQFDLATAMFDLHPKAGSSIDGLNAGAFSPGRRASAGCPWHPLVGHSRHAADPHHYLAARDHLLARVGAEQHRPLDARPDGSGRPPAGHAAVHPCHAAALSLRALRLRRAAVLDR